MGINGFTLPRWQFVNMHLNCHIQAYMSFKQPKNLTLYIFCGQCSRIATWMGLIWGL